MVSRDEKKEFLKVAVDNMPQDFFLDSWWQYLAENKIWINRSKEPKPLKLESLSNTYLYNIRSWVIRAAGDCPGKGAINFIGLITFILNKKAMESETLDIFK